MAKCGFDKALVALTKYLHGVTSYEASYGSKPNVSHFRVFTCIAYAQIGKEHRLKLDVRSTECAFVRYRERRKVYHVYNTTTRRIYSSRDVIFYEGYVARNAKIINNQSIVNRDIHSGKVPLMKEDVNDDEEQGGKTPQHESAPHTSKKVPNWYYNVIKDGQKLDGEETCEDGVRCSTFVKRQPTRYGDVRCALMSSILNEDDVPTNFQEAYKSPNWQRAM